MLALLNAVMELLALQELYMLPQQPVCTVAW